ncbi:MAG: hypothetical protein K0S75_2023 [Clostridia bacterium]|jgi:hypothetical protein|nr:hypothetical protein [Clostridia bacterium]
MAFSCSGAMENDLRVGEGPCVLPQTAQNNIFKINFKNIETRYKINGKLAKIKKINKE